MSGRVPRSIRRADAERAAALERVVRWACDAEDLDFYARDHPEDPQGQAVLRQLVL